MNRFLFVLFLCAAFAFVQVSWARAPRAPDYFQALDALAQGRKDAAETLVAVGNDPALNEVLLGRLMALPGNDYPFDKLATFVFDHPHWPGLSGILMIAEQKIPSEFSPTQVMNWFMAWPPLTAVGFSRFVEALNALGQSDIVARLVRERWIDKDFAANDFSAFRARYAPLLRSADHRARLDRLLWERKTAAARQMYPFLGKNDALVAEARIALFEDKKDVVARVQRVSGALQNDPGFLYERALWRRQKGRTEEIPGILERISGKTRAPELVWREKHIAARKLIENKSFLRAYRLASAHGLKAGDGADYLQAEFLSGWLALRFLRKPGSAQKHFEAMVDAAQSPISKARAHYWLGRVHEKAGRKDAARQAYEAAAVFHTAFYGQLAAAKINAAPTIQAFPEPAISAQVRAAFFDMPLVRATQRLAFIASTDRAEPFFFSAMENAERRVDFALLMELAHTLDRQDWAIRAAKKAGQKGFLLTGAAYPVLSDIPVPEPPESALTHALVRQESMFRVAVKSPVGARGLMQLMPATAQEEAQRQGLSYAPERLDEPAYNIALGSAFAQRQLDAFGGSYILALAAYNAGPGRVREWLALFGDPRAQGIDPIDWVEAIPVYETRNYVQRVLENLQFYRARLSGGQVPLRILRDLTSGTLD